MHHLLNSTVLAALIVGHGTSHAQPNAGNGCDQGPTLYAAGQHRSAFRIFFACAIAGDAAAQYSAAMMMRSGESNDEHYPNAHGARVFLEQSASKSASAPRHQ